MSIQARPRARPAPHRSTTSCRERGEAPEPANLRLAHRRCNGRRGSRVPELDWPEDFGVIDPAPLWQSLQLARRRPGDWETVAIAASGERAHGAARWAMEAAGVILGGRWESRVTPSTSGVHLIALRAAA